MKKNYDFAVIGGGSAGLVAATTAKRLGASVVLIEKHKTGGECLHTGCVPSKTLIHTAKVYHQMTHASKYGLSDTRPSLDFGRVMDHVHGIIDSIYHDESPTALRETGIDVVEGNPVFTSSTTLSLNGTSIEAGKTIVCTGSSPLILPIQGLDKVPYLTNESLWNIRTLPQSMVIIGGGPISVEIGQSFARFGAQVTIVEALPRILPNEDEEISLELANILSEEGIRLMTSAKVVSVAKTQHGVEVFIERGNAHESIEAATLLVSIGRSPNVDGLQLERAGVDYSRRGIAVNTYLQTSSPSVYACGDVVGPYRFTHTAGYQAGVATQNALLGNVIENDLSVLPWVTFTDPEAARVGLTEAEARKKFGSISVVRVSGDSIDRPKTESNAKGVLKILLDANDKILGVHALAPHAGEYIHEAALSMQNGLGIEALGRLIHAYPTHAEMLKKAATRYLRTKQPAMPEVR